MSAPRSPSLLSVRRHLRFGVAASVLLAGALTAWGATAKLSGAVVTHGQLVVASSVKKVQHPTGGVVGELAVHDGDHVEAGQVLLRLDATQARASLGIVVRQMDELEARQARVRTEQTGDATVAFPEALLRRADDPTVARLLQEEARLFAIRREAREGERAQLRQKILEFGEEIAGLEEQIRAKDEQLVLIDQELKGVQELVDRQLTPFSRVAALKRDQAALRGERGQFQSSIAAARGRIAEGELQIIQIDHTMRSEASRDLGEIRASLSELAERRTAAEDQLARIDIRAPQAGTVHQLDVHTVGGVVRPGETIMEIVPQDDRLIVEANLPPQDINDVHVGQQTDLRFSAANSRTTPEILGEVLHVSADVSQETRTGASYYSIRVGVSPDQLARLGAVKPVPGMPVEVFLKTRERTAFDYLVEPLAEQMSRSFREK
ncbi:HlyD family type I secretion periplasmic adaptor subunit [Aureimonas sp. AU4]|uniref:HlyD family type I secretion periplasmic adaptor subunit n=1 Tax=Aureimonas sp. AU4 TaxID=1638163 RepID=UPI0007806807|nr:HlyD family type I secretion periplasmic adaptor subunit [Aureimonas sp. AU4]